MRSRRWIAMTLAALLLALILAPETCEAQAGSPASSRADLKNDLLFRPTVIVRRGSGQGSGTVIASIAGESLILTAAHVLRDEGLIEVEAHRYNFGVEKSLPPVGWPLIVPAELVASDAQADVAIVRFRGLPALRYVARLPAMGDEPARGAVVTSVGVDRGETLGGWPTRVRGTAWFGIAAGLDEPSERFQADAPARGAEVVDRNHRPFLLTDRAPISGRSGGGLFDVEGRLAGVCVGRIELENPRAIGVYSSFENVRMLLREHQLDVIVAESEVQHARSRLTPTSHPAQQQRGAARNESGKPKSR